MRGMEFTTPAGDVVLVVFEEATVAEESEHAFRFYVNGEPVTSGLRWGEEPT